MTADLLRRAAKALRDRADAMPEPMRSEVWRVVLTDTESASGVAACDEHTEFDDYAVCDACHPVETWQEDVAAYVAMLHPPVALLLSDWLDHTAEMWLPGGSPVGSYFACRISRAVLREAEA